MTLLQTDSLTLGYGENIVIDELDVSVPQGKITVFVGANGCGKSTLLRSMARLLQPKRGEVMLNNELLTKMKSKEIAKELAILPQGPTAPEGINVRQLVKQGRYPHQTILQQWSAKDEELVQRALEVTQTIHLAERSIDSLSGGQRQRVWIAMTLAQDTEVVLLDEPTTYLDLSHQVDVLDLCFDLNQTEGRSIVMVLHDLNLAARYAHHMIALKDKKIHVQGAPENIINAEMVRNVFDMNSTIISDPLFGTPMCIPHGKGRLASKPSAKAE